MYFLRYKTIPNPISLDLKEFGAGYALCWINRQTQKEAEDKAGNNIVEAGWDIIELEEAYPVTLAEIDPNHPSFKFFLNAQDNGEYVLFVTGSATTQDDDAA